MTAKLLHDHEHGPDRRATTRPNFPFPEKNNPAHKARIGDAESQSPQAHMLSPKSPAVKVG
jgi:hypothetical protein